MSHDQDDLLGRGIRMDPLLPPMTPTSDAPPPAPAGQQVPEHALEDQGERPSVRPSGQALSAQEVAQLQQTADPAQQEAERALERAEGRVDHTES
ncbi:hypothetical protein [Deinococcus peraridilitoris]|uniref:Uncharacterized protein n=1 Tax=Deinococcus peraridilitoris (strain DSM 19664 / LMG 22246 / CIP 109416 / KR-200) TaxID=937777 RepID=L0A183_DEIPD|nr:hypothetical protein [Deinococcus peraridilitoris]AFZ67638.1 hypothetical protein Deipe_2148 [Deinococcus peraridilitoris DSM 19664]